jgi:hypothetical protein
VREVSSQVRSTARDASGVLSSLLDDLRTAKVPPPATSRLAHHDVP